MILQANYYKPLKANLLSVVCVTESPARLPQLASVRFLDVRYRFALAIKINPLIGSQNEETE